MLSTCSIKINPQRGLKKYLLGSETANELNEHMLSIDKIQRWLTTLIWTHICQWSDFRLNIGSVDFAWTEMIKALFIHTCITVSESYIPNLCSQQSSTYFLRIKASNKGSDRTVWMRRLVLSSPACWREKWNYILLCIPFLMEPLNRYYGK